MIVSPQHELFNQEGDDASLSSVGVEVVDDGNASCGAFCLLVWEKLRYTFQTNAVRLLNKTWNLGAMNRKLIICAGTHRPQLATTTPGNDATRRWAITSVLRSPSKVHKQPSQIYKKCRGCTATQGQCGIHGVRDPRTNQNVRKANNILVARTDRNAGEKANWSHATRCVTAATVMPGKNRFNKEYHVWTKGATTNVPNTVNRAVRPVSYGTTPSMAFWQTKSPPPAITPLVIIIVGKGWVSNLDEYQAIQPGVDWLEVVVVDEEDDVVERLGTVTARRRKRIGSSRALVKLGCLVRKVDMIHKRLEKSQKTKAATRCRGVCGSKNDPQRRWWWWWKRWWPIVSNVRPRSPFLCVLSFHPHDECQRFAHCPHVEFIFEKVQAAFFLLSMRFVAQLWEK